MLLKKLSNATVTTAGRHVLLCLGDKLEIGKWKLRREKQFDQGLSVSFGHWSCRSVDRQPKNCTLPL
jgi:hypothetical protein